MSDMISKLQLFLLTTCLLCDSLARSVEVTMITEVVKAFQQPSQIVQFSCNMRGTFRPLLNN